MLNGRPILVNWPEKRSLARISSIFPLVVVTVATVVLFLFAVQLLGTTTNAAAPALRQALTRVVVGGSSALGVSWLAACVVGNGSVVAALALSMYNAGLVPVSQLFFMIAGL